MYAPQASHSSPIVLRKRAIWDGIRLEHYYSRAGDLPEHYHREHLITLSLDDGCNGEIRTASGFRTRDRARGSVCVIPSGRPYTARLASDGEHLALYLDPALVLRAANGSRAVEVVERCSPSDAVVRSVGIALLAEVEAGGPGSRLYAESLANVLAVHLLRHYTAAGVPAQPFTGGLSGRRLKRVMEFIAGHYESDLGLAELARVAGMSTFHFAREFKRTTGTTPHQYLIKFRIDRAKALLAQSDLPLVEVGFQSGFSHQSHFTRLFHRLTGTTPHVYRLMSQPRSA